MHLVHSFMVLCLTIFLHDSEGASPLDKDWYHVIVHNLTEKVVASDGTLTDYFDGEKWKMWSVHAHPVPYYFLNSALSWYAGSFPMHFSLGRPAALVLGSEKPCQPSWAGKADYEDRDGNTILLNEQWKVEKKGLRPIPLYNRCEPPMQLTVKDNRIYLEKPEVVNGDPNSLFLVITTRQYKDNF